MTETEPLGLHAYQWYTRHLAEVAVDSEFDSVYDLEADEFSDFLAESLDRLSIDLSNPDPSKVIISNLALGLEAIYVVYTVMTKSYEKADQDNFDSVGNKLNGKIKDTSGGYFKHQTLELIDTDVTEEGLMDYGVLNSDYEESLNRMLRDIVERVSTSGLGFTGSDINKIAIDPTKIIEAVKNTLADSIKEGRTDIIIQLEYEKFLSMLNEVFYAAKARAMLACYTQLGIEFPIATLARATLAEDRDKTDIIAFLQTLKNILSYEESDNKAGS